VLDELALFLADRALAARRFVRSKENAASLEDSRRFVFRERERAGRRAALYLKQ
jgi:hypothetical protein